MKMISSITLSHQRWKNAFEDKLKLLLDVEFEKNTQNFFGQKIRVRDVPGLGGTFCEYFLITTIYYRRINS